jgi:CheY-like chemotaxis protein
MDGFELGERLRAAFAEKGIVLLAVTGYAQEADRQRTAAAGFAAHLVKPVDIVHLDRLVRTRAGS